MSWVIRAFLGNTQKPRVSLGIVRGRPEQKKCEGRLSVESRVWKTRGVLPYKGLASDATTCCESQNMKPSLFLHVMWDVRWNMMQSTPLPLRSAQLAGAWEDKNLGWVDGHWRDRKHRHVYSSCLVSKRFRLKPGTMKACGSHDRKLDIAKLQSKACWVSRVQLSSWISAWN